MNTEKLVEWLINHIKINYKDDIALVIHCNSLKAPGEENSPFPEFFIPLTEKGKELACSFIIDGKKYDFYYRTWDYLKGFENVSDYDTMIFADSKVIYARSEDDIKNYDECKRKLFENLGNDKHMKQIALKDYMWAIDVYKDNCLKTSLSSMMVMGGYVCDLLVHSLASINNKYIPNSFTNQYEFLEGMKNKPQNFSKLYLKINQSKDISEIRNLCAEIINTMKLFLNVYDEKVSVVDTDGLAGWYEEMIEDWSRIRGFAARNEVQNVRGWATKFQYALDNASKNYGIKQFELLSKFDEKDLSKFLKYADEIEIEIRNMLMSSHTKLNEFNSVEEFINEFGKNKLRK